jgi:formylglycine-generating enzyme required for sulfatase activity
MKRYWWFAVAVPFAALALLMTCSHKKNPTSPTNQPPHIDMVSIPGGSFVMGSTTQTPEDSFTFSNALPVRTVTISPFSMSRTLITQGLYDTVMDTNPSHWQYGSNYPVEQVYWEEAVVFCNKLSKLCSLDTVYWFNTINEYGQMDTVFIDYSKNGYRMPTEAEWEYAYRAGTTTDYYWGRNYPVATHDDTVALNSNAVWWYAGDSLSTAPVATKSPNPWGLYDMAGNVFTWCNDWYDNDYSNVLTQTTDPTGAPTGFLKVCRGGSWGYYNCGFIATYTYAAPFRWNMYLFNNGWMTGLRVVRRP